MAKITASLSFEIEVADSGLEAFQRKLEGGSQEIDAAASTLVASVSNPGGNAPDTVPLRRALLRQSGVLDKVKRGAGWEPPAASAKTKAKAAEAAADAKS